MFACNDVEKVVVMLGLLRICNYIACALHSVVYEESVNQYKILIYRFLYTEMMAAFRFLLVEASVQLDKFYIFEELFTKS